MRIFLHEISDQDTDLHFSAQDAWIYDAVRSVDEENPESSHAFRPTLPRPAPVRMSDRKPEGKAVVQTDREIDADFNLRKVDDVLIVSGELSAPVRLLCSRCATPFLATLHPTFQLLFTKDPELAGVSGARGDFHRESGRARHAHDDDERNLDISHLTEEFIDLGDVVVEQLQLTLPFQPLCKTDCKGICTNCGADLNKGKCACRKIAGSQAFAALKDLKAKKAGS